MRGGLRVCVAGLLLLSVGCSTASAARERHVVFVGESAGHLAMVEWSNDHGALTAVTVKSAAVDAAAASGLRERSAAGAGRLTGNAAQLTLNGSEVSASIAGSTLTLTLPGESSPTALKKASAPRYDRSVVLLRIEGKDAAAATQVAASRAQSELAVHAAAETAIADQAALTAEISLLDHSGVLDERLQRMEAATAAMSPLIDLELIDTKAGRCAAAQPRVVAVSDLQKTITAEGASFAADVASMTDAIIRLQRTEEKTIVDLRALSAAATYGVAVPTTPNPREISALMTTGDGFSRKTKQALTATRPRAADITINARRLQKTSARLLTSCLTRPRTKIKPPVKSR